MRTTHIYYIGSSRFWSVDLSWYHPNWARDLLITLVIAWHKTSCHNLLCIFFSLRVCSWLPQQIFSLSILLLLFLRYFNHSILVQKYKILQISIICYGHIIFIPLWLKLSWYDMRRRFTFILFKDIVIFYTYKIEWKSFQTKYHEPRFSHTAFPRCIFKFISNQCNL